MYTDYGPLHALPYRLRSARQKRRSQKADFEKQLIQLHKQQIQLRRNQAQLPWIPLAEPYQKGWKRFFVLREDVRRSEQAPFYQTLLDKINTVQFDKDKTFSTRRRKKRTWIYETKPQSLCEFSPWHWDKFKLKLTPKEKTFFYRRETWCSQSQCLITQYVYAEPWRFVLRIRPNIITHVKMIDADLESQIQRLKNYMESNHLEYKMYRMTKSRRSSPWWRNKESIKPKEKDPFHNMSLHSILEESKEQKI